MYELKKLQPRIVDVAIRLIESGAAHYTCLALERAGKIVYKKGWKAGAQYKWEYSEMIRGAYFEKKEPIWWNSDKRHLKSRVAALKRFKKHLEKQG